MLTTQRSAIVGCECGTTIPQKALFFNFWQQDLFMLEPLDLSRHSTNLSIKKFIHFFFTYKNSNLRELSYFCISFYFQYLRVSLLSHVHFNHAQVLVSISPLLAETHHSLQNFQYSLLKKVVNSLKANAKWT